MRARLLISVFMSLGCGALPGIDAGIVDAGSSIDSGVLDAGPKDAGTSLGAPGNFTYAIAAFAAREYDVHVPTGYDGVTALPVVLVLHGGGGDKDIARKTTCPNGDLTSGKCLDVYADATGFIIVYPDGTGGPLLGKLKTWNAGGGDGGWQCVSGFACTSAVDEKSYFTALLAHLATKVHFDAKRVFATGHSNGAAMSQALACQLPIAGIAPVAGGNQYSTTKPCTAPTPVLEIHGTADPCWLFDGGDQSCADTNPGSKISVAATLAGWRLRNGCSETEVTTSVPDTTNDGTTTTVHAYNCPAGREVVLYEVVGGGHTWPSGSVQGSNTGPISTDFSANEAMLTFFAAH